MNYYIWNGIYSVDIDNTFIRMLETTDIYTQVSTKSLQKVHNPLDAILTDNTLNNNNLLTN
jgi:hypothetical protein